MTKSPAHKPSRRVKEIVLDQARTFLAQQPRIMPKLKDFAKLRKMARSGKVEEMEEFIRARAADAAEAQIVFWKQFFNIPIPQKGRKVDPKSELAASMRLNGLTYPEIAQQIAPGDYERDPEATANRIRKNVQNYLRRIGMHRPGESSRR